jgi:hypothetical protein
MMRNCSRTIALLALASLLALSGAVFAGDNANATFTLTAPTQVTGIGPGATVDVSVSAAGMVGVKQFDITLEWSPADAFDLASSSFAANSKFALALPVVEEVAAGQGKGGAAALAAVTGANALGTFSLVTSSTVTTATTITLKVIKVSLGPSSSVRDEFPPGTADILNSTITINPPAPAPTITSIAPTSGPTTGATAVTITGANFQSGATVTIGGVAATNVHFADATTLHADTPAGAEGAADVVVTNPDGKSATLTGGLTFVGIIEPRLTTTSAADVSLDFSAVGKGNLADNSAGEVTFAVSFKGNTGAAGAGQAISFAVTNNGAEKVYVLGTPVVTVNAGATQIVTRNSAADGSASVVLDAEGTKTASTTSATVAVSATATNSEGTSRSLTLPAFSATWDVPVAAELASFAATSTPNREVVLEWTVASQSNNLGWEVFRSVDQVRFERVSALIPGDGTTDQFRSYTAVDANAPEGVAVFYYLKQIDLDGTTARSSVIEVSLSQPVLPTVSALWQNFPNPFNPETTISFDLSGAAVVSLTVYDAAGQVVRTLVAGQSIPAGQYRQLWDGRSDAGVKVGSGVYFYQLKAGDFSSIKKMTLVQ